MMDPGDRVCVFDTTLRDGEQSPGCTMSGEEKLDIARQLARLGADVIEAGFPAASSGDRDAVAAVAEEVGGPDGPIICGLARATDADIACCAGAIRRAARPRLHTFIATSDIHLRHKLHMRRDDVIKAAARAVAHARSLVDDVEFSPEDATRSDPAFLDDVLAAAIESGATTINVPDTVGYAVPGEYATLIARVCALAARTASPGIVVSTHCHDDLGLAVANTLAGVQAGARQVECTINGIGERAGNASLEEVVMAIATRADHFGVRCAVNTHELSATSRLVAASTGAVVAPNKAVVGSNAFAHEAGIHQDGVLKHRETYEIMNPAAVGVDHTTLVIGKHSGRSALRQRLCDTGYHLDAGDFERVFLRLKELADAKKIIDDDDIACVVRALTLADSTPPSTSPPPPLVRMQ